ncbi:hypothetical protein ACHAWF_002684 [Thalassiosira exigua]
MNSSNIDHFNPGSPEPDECCSHILKASVASTAPLSVSIPFVDTETETSLSPDMHTIEELEVSSDGGTITVHACDDHIELVKSDDTAGTQPLPPISDDGVGVATEDQAPRQSQLDELDEDSSFSSGQCSLLDLELDDAFSISSELTMSTISAESTEGLESLHRRLNSSPKELLSLQEQMKSLKLEMKQLSLEELDNPQERAMAETLLRQVQGVIRSLDQKLEEATVATMDTSSFLVEDVEDADGVLCGASCVHEEFHPPGTPDDTVLDTLRKTAVGLGGGLLTLAGIALMPVPVVPGGALVAYSGLLVLATEFEGAKNLCDMTRGWMEAALQCGDKICAGAEGGNSGEGGKGLFGG